MDRFEIPNVLFSERLYYAISENTIIVKIVNYCPVHYDESLKNDFSVAFLRPPNDIEVTGMWVPFCMLKCRKLGLVMYSAHLNAN